MPPSPTSQPPRSFELHFEKKNLLTKCIFLVSQMPKILTNAIERNIAVGLPNTDQ